MVTFVHIGFYLAWLISVTLSVTASISISVFTEVSGLSFGLELVDIVNHCLMEKNLRLLSLLIL